MPSVRYEVDPRYLPALLKGDRAGLGEKDLRDLDDFMALVRAVGEAASATTWHWNYDEAQSPEFGACEVSGMVTETVFIRQILNY